MAEEGGEDPLIAGDVSTSDAFQFIHAALKAGEIDEDKATYARAKYAELHAAVLKAMANEKELFAKAKRLKERSLDEAKQLVESTGDMTAGQAIDQLREDADEAENEAVLCKEKETVLQIEVNDLMAHRNELRGELEQLERDKEEEMQPQIDAIKATVRDLKKEIESIKKTHDDAISDSRSARQTHEKYVQNIRELQREKALERQTMEKMSQMPERLRKQTAVVENALKLVVTQGQDIGRKMKREEEMLRVLNEKVEKKEKQTVENAGAVQRANDEIHKMRVKADSLAGDVQDMVHTNMQFEMEAAQIQVELNAREATVSTNRIQLNHQKKNCDNSIQHLKTLTANVKGTEAVIPEMKGIVDQLHKAKNTLQSHLKKQAGELETLTREVEIYVNQYLKKEMEGKGKSLAVQHSSVEVEEYEYEVASLKKEEGVRDKSVVDLGSQVERMARMATAKVTRYRETVEAVRVKDLIISDLKKKKKDTLRRLKDFQQLYDLVKNQRNKFVNLIQASSQSIAEFKEKLKILSNEISILQNDILSKEKLLTKARLDHSNGQMERDHLRSELNKCALAFREKQETVDEQIAEVDKLNAIINATEKEMLRLKKQYETHVENRNLTGIMLIDRNDELCILYEKLNIQEKVIREGEMRLNERVDETWHLNLAIKEVARSVEVTRKLQPIVPELDDDVASLQKQLLDARMQSQTLSEELESPDNKGRWRRLPGKIPDKEELKAKISQLEERLNDKKEQLLEKELVLDEVTTLSDRLRQQAADGRGETLDLAKKVNDYQARLRAMTRKMMATVSELSMYQASALKLQAVRQEMEEEYTQAEQNLAEGLPPTDDTEADLARMERYRQRLQEAKMLEAEYQAGVQSAVTRTTAEPRPNAYVPEDLGIPKPYGRYAPFKPQDAGATMRHMRKPEPKEVEI